MTKEATRIGSRTTWLPGTNSNAGISVMPTANHSGNPQADTRHGGATLADVSWLVGSWEGEAFGGTFEEVWNPPSKGSMVGFFKFMGDEAVAFYELLLLVEEEGSLSLKVKHFNPDFSAWEEREDYVDFRFVSADDDIIHFSGISFYRMSQNEIQAWIRMRSGDQITEEKLVYRRVED